MSTSQRCLRSERQIVYVRTRQRAALIRCVDCCITQREILVTRLYSKEIAASNPAVIVSIRNINRPVQALVATPLRQPVHVILLITSVLLALLSDLITRDSPNWVRPTSSGEDIASPRRLCKLEKHRGSWLLLLLFV